MRVEPGSLESEWVRRGQATGCRRRRCCCCGDSGSRCVQAKPSLWVRQQWDQIFHFIALGATLQSLGQQLFCPKRHYFYANFVKVSKSFILLVKSFLGNFYVHSTTFSGHAGWERERGHLHLLTSITNSKYACLKQIVAAKWKQQQNVVVSLAMMPPLLQCTAKIFYALKIHVEREREREK